MNPDGTWNQGTTQFAGKPSDTLPNIKTGDQNITWQDEAKPQAGSGRASLGVPSPTANQDSPEFHAWLRSASPEDFKKWLSQARPEVPDAPQTAPGTVAVAKVAEGRLAGAARDEAQKQQDWAMARQRSLSQAATTGGPIRETPYDAGIRAQRAQEEAQPRNWLESVVSALHVPGQDKAEGMHNFRANQDRLAGVPDVARKGVARGVVTAEDNEANKRGWTVAQEPTGEYALHPNRVRNKDVVSPEALAQQISDKLTQVRTQERARRDAQSKAAGIEVSPEQEADRLARALAENKDMERAKRDYEFNALFGGRQALPPGVMSPEAMADRVRAFREQQAAVERAARDKQFMEQLNRVR
jgi:hypothetical protein